MPSWNIHTAHAERLLQEAGAEALGIRNEDAFLLGNLLPDLYVGYMVPDVSHKLDYRETHFADPRHVPEARYWEFFELYGQRDAEGRVSDLILGAWAHLVADNCYNHNNNVFIQAHGIEPSAETRQRKQADFALFGRTLLISRVPHITDEVLAQCAAFPQYEVLPQDVFATQVAMEQIVRDNTEHHIEGTPDYDMLTAGFFPAAFDETDSLIRTGLEAYAAGDQDWGRQR